MKNKIYISLISMILPVILFGQTKEEIIDRHIKAHGGKAKWEQVKSMTLSGTFTGFSLEKAFTCHKTSDGKYYADFYMGEKQVVEAYDGQNGWTIDPWQDMDYARKLNRHERDVLHQKALFFTPFISYQENGYEVKYDGIDTLEGTQVFKLTVSHPDYGQQVWFLNTETYLEYACFSTWVDFARGMPSETYFDDFREVDGLVIPHYINRTFWQRDRTWQYEKIEFNTNFEDEWLEMPCRPEIEKLSFLEGKWEVKLEAMTRRGTWYPMGTTEAEFSFTTTNLLQEKITYERQYPMEKHTSYSWNEIQGNYRMTVFDDVSNEVAIFNGHFIDSTFVYDNLDVTFGENNVEPPQYMRYTIFNISENSFVMHRHMSMDKGKSWHPRDQFTYTRKE